MIPKYSKIMEPRQAIVAQQEENSEVKELFVVSNGVESAKDEN